MALETSIIYQPEKFGHLHFIHSFFIQTYSAKGHVILTIFSMQRCKIGLLLKDGSMHGVNRIARNVRGVHFYHTFWHLVAWCHSGVL